MSSSEFVSPEALLDLGFCSPRLDASLRLGAPVSWEMSLGDEHRNRTLPLQLGHFSWHEKIERMTKGHRQPRVREQLPRPPRQSERPLHLHPRPEVGGARRGLLRGQRGAAGSQEEGKVHYVVQRVFLTLGLFVGDLLPLVDLPRARIENPGPYKVLNYARCAGIFNFFQRKPITFGAGIILPLCIPPSKKIGRAPHACAQKCTPHA